MKIQATLVLLSALLSVALGFGTLCGSDGSAFVAPPQTVMPDNFKVAFLGDAGVGSPQREVLQLVKNWGAQVVIHSGDFDYNDSPSTFENNINAVLGADFPYFASIGNHDVPAWSGYYSNLAARITRIGADVNCTGEAGVNMACNWNGLYFVLSGVGTRGSGHVNYVHDAFEAYPAVWKVVSWHKNQRLMQIGGKSDETGWDIYDATREHGAIIMTGHEHSYCRSHMMSNIEDQVIANTNATLNLKVGESFVVVSGLGGNSIREWDEDLYDNEWWAAVGADDNGVSDGVLLCTFNIDGELRRAHCDFEDTDGQTYDSFDIYSELPSTKEEMDAQLAAVRAKRATKCRSEFIEIPIRRELAQAEELESGEAVCGSPSLSLRRGRTSALRFEDIPLPRGARVESAYLQLFSASSGEGRQHRYVITGSAERDFLPCQAKGESHLLTRPERKVTRSFATWTHEDEGWERHTVWVTPNLKDIVNEVLADEDWEQGSGLTLNISGKGRGSFYTFEHSPCVSPTLLLEVKVNC